MQHPVFASQYGASLQQTVRTMSLELESPEAPYRLKLSVVSLPPEGDPLEYLNQEEKDTYFGFQYARRRNSYLLGKLAAKTAVAEEGEALSGIQIEHGILCQPLVAGRNRKITITHCDSLGAAVGYDPRLLAGVDMELVDEKAAEAIRRITSREEEALLPELAAATALTLLWTAKEAMSKVIQTGFTVPTELFELKACTCSGSVVISQFKNFPQFQAVSILRKEYVYTLVLPAKVLAGSSETRLIEGLEGLLPDGVG
ncbi:4'-phosphopantetheinyl transferase superfamily protein [Paenibacillus sp. FSL H7-0756]